MESYESLMFESFFPLLPHTWYCFYFLNSSWYLSQPFSQRPCMNFTVTRLIYRFMLLFISFYMESFRKHRPENAGKMESASHSCTPGVKDAKHYLVTFILIFI